MKSGFQFVWRLSEAQPTRGPIKKAVIADISVEMIAEYDTDLCPSEFRVVRSDVTGGGAHIIFILVVTTTHHRKVGGISRANKKHQILTSVRSSHTVTKLKEYTGNMRQERIRETSHCTFQYLQLHTVGSAALQVVEMSNMCST